MCSHCRCLPQSSGADPAGLPKLIHCCRHLACGGQRILGSDRIDELLTTVKAVTQSEIWQRSQAATRCFSEIPYETSAIDAEGKALIVRGVIDLLFEEPQGWVIVDYKTDDFLEPEFDKAVTYYRRQLEIYAEHWFRSVGENVKELGLYFTRFDRYVVVPFKIS